MTTADTRPDARRVLASRAGAALTIALLLVAAAFVRRSGVDAQSLQQHLVALGCLAVPMFIVAFTIGELLHFPGTAFVVGARVLFGPTLGLAIGYTGALTALTVSFIVARGLVGAARATREPWRPKWGPLRKTFERVEAWPVSSIALLRLCFSFASPLTYAVAATRVSFRDHLLGTAIGMLGPVILWNLIGAAMTMS